MLTCKQASRLVSQSLDRSLSWPEKLQLRFHLLICNACNNFKLQLEQLRSSVQRLKDVTENDQTIQLSADAKAKILQNTKTNKQSA